MTKNSSIVNVPIALQAGVLAGMLALTSLPSLAQEAVSAEEAATVVDAAPAPADAGDAALIEQVKERLIERLPQFSDAEVSASLIPGLYEVVADGLILYMDETADYLIDGSMIRLSDRVNVTEARLGTLQKSFIDEMDDDELLIYEPEGEVSGTLTVFTDISCGFCRKLHEEIDTLTDAGVRVRYVLFPRAGLGSQAHKDLVSVWCADNPQEAMTNAKAGGKITPLTCDNPIESHVAAGRTVGLQGTPLMFTSDGERITGYRPAEALVTAFKNGAPVDQVTQ